MALTLNHQTAAEFAARFWRTLKRAYEDGDKRRYGYLVWWIWARVQAGDLTNDQVRLSFNAAFGKSLNTTQWNTLVTTKFVPIKDAYLATINAEDVTL